MVAFIERRVLANNDDETCDCIDYPLTYALMDGVTEFISPRHMVVRTNEMSRAITGIEVRAGGKQLILDAEIGMAERTGRKIVGAFCYAGLLLVAEIEMLVRIPLYFLGFLYSVYYYLQKDDPEFITLFRDLTYLACIFLVDAPIRTISALVQKCLLDVCNERRVRKDFSELTVCELIHIRKE
ncbi:MAG: hypothetical protein HYX48_02475 [Chlamydiales bacterium]|nr:hypothetical protein [Chlamydiales bacterium]